MKKNLLFFLFIAISTIAFSQITITSTVTNVSCFGGSNGSATVTATGGIGAYTYTWMPTNTNFSIITGLAAGQYTVIAEDAVANTSSLVVTIIEPTALNISANVTNVICFGTATGSATLNVSGGTPAYSYTWSSTSSSSVVTGLSAGNYTYQIKDANNCIATQTVTIAQSNQLTATMTATNSNCGQANGAICTSVSGGVGAVSYLWSNGNTTSCNNNIPAGAYTFTVTDANGCVASSSGLVNDIAGPSVSINSQANVSCFGMCNGMANVLVNGGTSPYAFNWSNGSTAQTATNLCAGVYIVQVTDANGCVSSQSFVISQPPPINVSLSYTNATCNNCDGAANAMVTGGNPVYMFQWSHTGNNMSSTQNLCAGIYTLVVTDASGCYGYGIASISGSGSIIPNFSATTTAYPETCLNSGDGSIDVSTGGSNPGPFTYQWSNGATTQDVTNISSGMYWVTITDGSANCMTLMDTISSIGTNCGTISGNVFIDNNGDCFKNSGDYNFTNALVMVNPGNRHGFANYNGDYTISNLPYGTYSISLNMNASGNLFPTCTTTLNTTVNSGNPNSSNNLLSAGFNSGSQPDLTISAWNQGIVPGFVCRMNYYLNNLNNVNAFGVFKVTLPSAFIPNINNASPATYTVSGDTVIWNFSNVTYNNTSQFFFVDFTTPLSTPLGSIFTSCAYALPTVTDLNPANNTYCYQRTVNGSFDPNDKSVSPVGVGPNGDITPAETDLTYLIRFQNTGNGPAVNIMVLDTLSANVDVSTFQMLSASHNYNVEVLDGNILKWKFNNIMLVDSNTNEPASHGYIQYKIKRNSNNTPGTQIKNTAYIYFDFNDPVVTNTTLNTIAIPTGIITTNNKSNDWAIYPNPSTGTLYIANASSVSGEQTSIQILNSIGQTVYEETINSNHKTIDLSKLNNGVYFVKIVSDKQTTVKRMVLSK